MIPPQDHLLMNPSSLSRMLRMKVPRSHAAPRRLSERGIYSPPAAGGLKFARRLSSRVAVRRVPRPIGELAFENQLLTPVSRLTAHLLPVLLFSLTVLNLGCISTERTVYREQADKEP